MKISRNKIFRQILIAILVVTVIWPLLPKRIWGTAGNEKGDIAKEYLIRTITLPGVSYNSFGTVNAENLYHLGLEGADHEKITVFCLDAPKNFGTGSAVRCIGSLDENGDIYTTEERKKLKGLMYFFSNNRVFKDQNLKQMLTQLGVWYVRTHKENPDFHNAVFQADVESILQDPNVCYNIDQAIKWYKDMTGISLEVGQYSHAYELIAELFIRELDGAVAAGDNIVTYIWSTGKSLYQNLITTEAVQPWEDKGRIEVYKRDGDGNALAGAVFTATNAFSGEKYSIGPTDGAGHAVSDLIPSGTYTVAETKFPSGFTSSGNDSWRVTVEFDRISRVGGDDGTVINVPALGSVKLLKENEKGQALSGAEFGIYEDTECRIAVNVLKTGADGTVTFSNLTGGRVYYVKETSPANENYLLDNTVYSVTVVAGSTIWVKDGQALVNSLKKGSVGVIKQDEKGRGLSGVIFGVYSDSQCFNELGRMTTGSEGEGILENLDCAQTVFIKEISPKDNTYVQDITVYKADVAADTITWVNSGKAVVNEQKKWQLTVYKRDSKNDTLSAGDAEVKGAVYGLYNASDELLDRYTTDINGSFTTKSFAADIGYYLKEIEGPAGYRLDSRRHGLDKFTDPQALTAALTPGELILSEEVKTGTVSIIKWAEEGNKKIPEEGAAFVIYLKSAGSYEAAMATGDSRVYDSAVVNAAGTAVWSGGGDSTKDLAYGNYVIRQTVSTDGHRPVADTEVEIKEDGKQYAFGFENPSYKTTLTVNKRDAESGELIVSTPAVFRIKDIDRGEYVSYTTIYPNKKTITEFSTTNGTFTLPVPLTYGQYAIEEVQAPEGYLPLKEAVIFTVSEKTPPVYMMNIGNTPLKGKIELEKRGQIFVGFQKEESEFGIISYPVFEEAYLADCIFNIIAREDIISGDGRIRLKKGDTAGQIISRGDGPVLSDELYVGEYELIETAAPDGYLLSETPIAVSVSNDGEGQAAIQRIQSVNERATVRITVQKEMTEWEEVEQNGYRTRKIKKVPGAGFIFGLYTAENMVTNGGDESLAENSLVALLTTDERGQGSIEGVIPLGEYYLKELKAPDKRFILSGEQYKASVSSLGNMDKIIEVEVNDGKAIQNEFKRWAVKIKKVDSDSSEPLAGGIIEIRDKDQKLLYRSITGEDGTLDEVLLEPGVYTGKEIAAPDGYAICTDPFTFTVDQDGKVSGDTVIKDEPTSLKIQKVNENNEVIAGVEFELLDTEEKRIVSAVTDENGMIEFRGIPRGQYILREITTPKGYQKAEKDISVVVTAAWCNKGEYANIKIVNRTAVDTGDPVDRGIINALIGTGSGAFLILLFLYSFKKEKQKQG